MNMSGSSGTDRPLLFEIMLTLVVIAVAIVLYLRPAAGGGFAPAWWHWLVLGLLFFGLVGFGTWRRRRRRHAALHQAIREESGGP